MSKFIGIYKAIVYDLNDPESRGRARLQVPAVLGTAVSGWAVPLHDSPRAEFGDHAWVLFEDGDLNRPVWSTALGVSRVADTSETALAEAEGAYVEALSAAADAAAASAAAATAQQEAEDALAAAADAQATADGKVQSFFQDTAPTGLTAGDTGDLWFDTNDSNKMYRWDGDSWEVAADTRITDALNAAALAQSTADGKINTYYQDNPPTAEAVGDLWVDTNDNNHLYRALTAGADSIGAPEWVSVRDATIAAASSSASAAMTEATAALTAAQAAQATADGAIRTYYSSTPPWDNNTSQPASVLGDMWFDQDDGQAYRWNGTTWGVIEDNSIAVALAAAQSAQTTADGKITAYYQDTQPVVGEVGDLWYDTDDKNRPYYCSSISPLTWLSVRDATIADAQATANAAQTAAAAADAKAVAAQGAADQAIADLNTAELAIDGKASTYFQDNPPWANGTAGHAVDTNDIWVDTNDSNKMYRWRDSDKTWVLSQDAGIGTALFETAKLYSMGTDLVINGTGAMGDNTNFSNATYSSTDVPAGAKGAFVSGVGAGEIRADQMFPVDPSKRFMFSFMARQRVAASHPNGSYMYAFVHPHDAYGLAMDPSHYMFTPGTTTTLAAALNPGDTTVTLTSSANWYGLAAKPAGSATHLRRILWWDYTDQGGKLWPQETYSRNVTGVDLWADGGITGNVITLRAPYSGPAKPVGTKLSGGSSGGTYMYGGAVNSVVPTTWTAFSATITGTAAPGFGADFSTGWPAGTAQCKIGWLTNRTAGAPWNDPASQHAVALVSFSDAAAAQFTANSKTTTYYQDNPPVATTVGDLWVDTDDSNHLYRALSVGADAIAAGEWVSVRDATIAAASGAAAAAQTAANNAQTAADNARAVADGATVTYYQSAFPWADTSGQPAAREGDLFFDTDDKTVWRWSHTSQTWVQIKDPQIQAALTAANTAQTTADGKIATYWSNSAPTVNLLGVALSAADTGDLWFDLDDKNKPYFWDGNSWEVIRDTAIDDAQRTADNAVLDGNYMVNPFMDYWPTGQSTPTGYTVSAGSAPIKETTLARTQPFAMRFNLAAGVNQYVHSDLTIPNYEYVSLTYDFYLVSGTLEGTGVLVRWSNTVPNNFDVTSHAHTDVPNVELGKWYRVTKTIKRPVSFTGTFNNIRIFTMGGWSGFGTVTAKDVIFDCVALRPATDVEIKAYNSASQAALDVVATSANGKSKVTYSTNTPGTTANSAGDVWFQRDGSGVVVGQWEGMGGTTWTARTLSHQTISSVDLGTATVGTLSAAKITASTQLTSPIVVGGSITGTVIIGGTFKTADSPDERLEINTDTLARSKIDFWSGSVNELSAASIQADMTTVSGVRNHFLNLRSHTMTNDESSNYAWMQLQTRQNTTTNVTTSFIYAEANEYYFWADNRIQLIADGSVEIGAGWPNNIYIDAALANGLVELKGQYINLGGTGTSHGLVRINGRQVRGPDPVISTYHTTPVRTNGNYLANSWATVTAYTAASISVPAGSRMAHITVSFEARAGANAAFYAYLVWAGFTVDTYRYHNDTDFYRNAGVTMSHWVNLSGSASTVDLRIDMDADNGGDGFNLSPGHVCVAFIG